MKKEDYFVPFFGICPVAKDYCIFYRKLYNICMFDIRKGKKVNEIEMCPDKDGDRRLGITKERKPPLGG